jgi:hypothetical protein
MTPRRAIGALLFASFALMAGACGGSDDASDSKDEDATTTTVDDSAGQTTTTLNDEDYLAQVAQITTAIEGAGTDLCALSEVTAAGPPEPANTAQVEAAVGLYASLLNALAGTLPAESAANADALRSSATTLQTAAADAGYPEDFFSTDAVSDALSGEAYDAAMTEYQTIYSSTCVTEPPAGAESPETTVPAG